MQRTLYLGDVTHGTSKVALYGKLRYWAVARRMTVHTLHETEMSLWFREKRFREEGKIGAFAAAKFPYQCCMPETLCPVQDQTGSHHIAREAKHMGHSN